MLCFINSLAPEWSLELWIISSVFLNNKNEFVWMPHSNVEQFSNNIFANVNLAKEVNQWVTQNDHLSTELCMAILLIWKRLCFGHPRIKTRNREKRVSVNITTSTAAATATTTNNLVIGFEALVNRWDLGMERTAKGWEHSQDPVFLYVWWRKTVEQEGWIKIISPDPIPCYHHNKNPNTTNRHERVNKYRSKPKALF